jgi:hypothetical protein
VNPFCAAPEGALEPPVENPDITIELFVAANAGPEIVPGNVGASTKEDKFVPDTNVNPPVVDRKTATVILLSVAAVASVATVVNVSAAVEIL